MRYIIVLAIIIAGTAGWFLWNILKKQQTVTTDPQTQKLYDDALFRQGLDSVQFSHTALASVREELHRKIIGMHGLIHAVIINLLCKGHLLVEGAPGLAKTKTLQVFSHIMGMDFTRIQFTPDMLPSDIIGVEIYDDKTKDFHLKEGPIMSNIVLADEINRATPKVQAALLEAMQERQVTIWGKTKKLPDPFMVLATQNPLEHEGTYPLPEAQLDRFLFKVLVDYPNHQEEKAILDMIEHEGDISIHKLVSHKQYENIIKDMDKIVVSDTIKNYISRLVQATRTDDSRMQYGASPRASISLMQAARAIALIEGRDHVNHEDIQRLSLPVLRHRIALSYDARVDGWTEDRVLLEILPAVSIA